MLSHLTKTKYSVASLGFLLVSVSIFPIPAFAVSVPSLASVKAIEQLVKIYDPKTSDIRVELQDSNCRASTLISNPPGYAKVCGTGQAIYINPAVADAIERREGLTVLSFVTANGIARARQVFMPEFWMKIPDLKGALDAQAECLSGVYLKSALPVTIPGQELAKIEDYILRTGTSSRVTFFKSANKPYELVVNGPIRVAAFRYGYDSGKLESCYVKPSSAPRNTFNAYEMVRSLLDSWLGKNNSVY